MSSTNTPNLAASIKSLGREWWLPALFGVITIAFGVVLTFRPGKSVHAIAVIFGIWLLILGIIRLIRAIGAVGERTELLVVGLLAILIAMLVLAHTNATVAVLGFLVGIFGLSAALRRCFTASARTKVKSLADRDTGDNCDDRRYRVPCVPFAVVVHHLRDRWSRHDRLWHRQISRASTPVR